MSLIKKSDVKNHLSARRQNRIHIVPVSQPDATGFSGTAAPIATSDESTVRPAPQAPADSETSKL